MNRRAEELLSVAETESQAKLQMWKTIGKRVAVLFLFVFIIGGIASTLNFYQNVSSKQFVLLLVTVIAYGALFCGVNWIHQKVFAQHQSSKIIVFVIEIILFLAFAHISNTILHNAAP
jgi:hypothetical protein